LGVPGEINTFMSPPHSSHFKFVNGLLCPAFEANFPPGLSAPRRAVHAVSIVYSAHVLRNRAQWQLECSKQGAASLVEK
jgi:hypothetical protein